MKKHLLIVSAAGLIALSSGAAVVPADVEQALRTAKPGDIVGISSLSIDKTNDIFNRKISETNDCRFRSSGGKLIYSDDPETVKECGILYQDTLEPDVKKSNRIYIYHVNGTSQITKITSVIQNISGFDATVTYLHKSLPQPSEAYLNLGMEGARLFYQNTNIPLQITLKPGEAALLDQELDDLSVTHEELVGGIYDVRCDQQLMCTILMLPKDAKTLETYKTCQWSPKDGRNREGSFSTHSKKAPNSVYTYNSTSGAKYFEIASNTKYTQNDLPLEGVIPQTGASVKLLGNYGVAYSIKVQADNDSDTVSKLVVALCPRGGAYTGFIRLTDENENIIADQLLPVCGDNTKVVVGGFIDFPQASHKTFTIEFMPAGSTSLPVWLLLIPIQ